MENNKINVLLLGIIVVSSGCVGPIEQPKNRQEKLTIENTELNITDKGCFSGEDKQTKILEKDGKITITGTYVVSDGTEVANIGTETSGDSLMITINEKSVGTGVQCIYKYDYNLTINVDGKISKVTLVENGYKNETTEEKF